MERPFVKHLVCGTQESWEKYGSEYYRGYRVVPATIYVSNTGVCLITSQAWVDWLTGKSKDIPNSDDLDTEREFCENQDVEL